MIARRGVRDDDDFGFDHRQQFDAIVDILDHRAVALGLPRERARSAVRDHAVEVQRDAFRRHCDHFRFHGRVPRRHQKAQPAPPADHVVVPLFVPFRGDVSPAHARKPCVALLKPEAGCASLCDPATRGVAMPADDHAHDHGSELSEMQLRVRALETILTEKGYVDPAALDQIVENVETKIGPHIGARIVARAWVDPEFKRRLLEDATEAANSMTGFDPVAAHLIAVENTPQLHHIVVCTLCSCYPWSVLGLPPVWYKSAPYRSRAVIDPKGVLANFGVTLPPETEIRVWDSTAEVRYLVLPERPSGTDGWEEAALVDLVTRDCMIGTGLPTP